MFDRLFSKHSKKKRAMVLGPVERLDQRVNPVVLGGPFSPGATALNSLNGLNGLPNPAVVFANTGNFGNIASFGGVSSSAVLNMLRNTRISLGQVGALRPLLNNGFAGTQRLFFSGRPLALSFGNPFLSPASVSGFNVRSLNPVLRALPSGLINNPFFLGINGNRGLMGLSAGLNNTTLNTATGATPTAGLNSQLSLLVSNPNLIGSGFSSGHVTNSLTNGFTTNTLNTANGGVLSLPAGALTTSSPANGLSLPSGLGFGLVGIGTAGSNLMGTGVLNGFNNPSLSVLPFLTSPTLTMGSGFVL